MILIMKIEEKKTSRKCNSWIVRGLERTLNETVVVLNVVFDKRLPNGNVTSSIRNIPPTEIPTYCNIGPTSAVYFCII